MLEIDDQSAGGACHDRFPHALTLVVSAGFLFGEAADETPCARPEKIQ